MLLFRYLFLLFVLVSFAIALTPAGISISNTAKIEYEDEKGFKYKDISNTVTITVMQVYGISIEPDYQSITSFPNKEIYIPYILKNTGNGKDRYILQVKNLLNDDGDISNIKIYIDKNENGVLDAGEIEYDNTNPPLLESQGYLPLLVVGKTPVSPPKGIYKISLEGQSLGDRNVSDIENITEIKVSPDFAVSINKETDKSEVFPGEKLVFNINVHNQGIKTIFGKEVKTDFNNDGLPEVRNGILIEDTLPKYTSFENANIYLVEGTVLFKGEEDSYWKNF